MKQVIVNRFGGPEVLEVVEMPTPEPGPGQVLLQLRSIGMNHADLMARRGDYKLSSGDPPFTPGLEGGGVIEAVGEGVTDRQVGQRVTLSPAAPRRHGGAYRSHYLVDAAETIPVPDALPDEQLGALWLTYLTAWGCLVWKQNLQAGQFVALPAASSGVALAAAQVAKEGAAVTIGLTTSAAKRDQLLTLPEADYDHIVVTSNEQAAGWHRELKQLSGGHGIDLFFDPVASGEYLNTEIRALAQHGVIWIYGLMGETGNVDVSPLIRKYGSMRGWLLNELIEEGGDALQQGYSEILDGFATGRYRQRIARTFKLDQVRAAHEYMEQGAHIGKLVLVP